jgi:hypothetical protein
MANTTRAYEQAKAPGPIDPAKARLVKLSITGGAQMTAPPTSAPRLMTSRLERPLEPFVRSGNCLPLSVYSGDVVILTALAPRGRPSFLI